MGAPALAVHIATLETDPELDRQPLTHDGFPYGVSTLRMSRSGPRLVATVISGVRRPRLTCVGKLLQVFFLINAVNRFSLPYHFLNNVSLAFYIVRMHI